VFTGSLGRCGPRWNNHLFRRNGPTGDEGLHSEGAVNTPMIDFNNASFVKLQESPEYAAQIDPILVEGEQILGCYKGIRDGVVFTDKRIIALNVQGITGKKRDYTSLPYSKIAAYSVESAGTFDLDAELDIWISGVGKVRFEFKGKSNILDISRMISTRTL
jgi:hypothetical protein